MKKRIALFALCALVLSGCGGNRMAETAAPTEESASAVEPLTETEAPRQETNKTGAVAVRSDREVLTGFEGDFQLITFEHDVTTVQILGNEAAAQRINDFLALQDRLYVEGDPDREDPELPQGYQEYLEAARQAYLEQPEFMNPYFFSRKVEAVSANDYYVSILVSTSDFTGGAHGNNLYETYVFSTKTGDLLHLEDLTNDNAAMSRALLDFMVESARKQPDIQNRIAWFGPEEYEENFRKLLRDGSWCLAGSELCLFSDPYEFGPYAAGVVDFRMPLELLKPFLKEEFFPAARRENGAMILREPVKEDILDTVTLDPEAPALALRAEGTVYNVFLHQVSLGENQVYKLNTLWFCSRMTEQTLEIRTWIPDAAPNLMVIYEDQSGQVYRALLTQSGKDGSYILQEDF